MFKVTSTAAQQVREAARQGGTEGMALRLAAQQRPDGTFDYQMGFDEATDDDICFNSEGVEVCIAPEYVPLLDATVMDYVEIEPGEHRFIFLNPKDPSFVPPEGA
jgi:iron-sulfur cluster assembly protein